MRLKFRTKYTIFSVRFSTYLYESENDWSINILTVFADRWETFSLGFWEAAVGMVVLNRAFGITLSRTSRD